MADAKAEATRLWELRDNQAFEEIREALLRMAPGREHCMYCEESKGTAIDHFWPRAVYPERAFDWLNYLLACSRCNSNFKRDQFPLDSNGDPLLLNPTEEDPLDHLFYAPSTGMYDPRSPKGQPSIQVFGLNDGTLPQGRIDAWTTLRNLLVRYAVSRAKGDDEEARKIETAVRHHPFSGVLAALIHLAEKPDAELLIQDQECLHVLADYPEIKTWA